MKQLPKGWHITSVSGCCENLDNKRKPLNSEERALMQGEIPYFGANGKVDSINAHLFDEELILIAEDGGFFDEFATRPIAYRIKGKSWVNNHAHVLRAREDVHQDFIYHSLRHKDIRRFLNGGTRAKLNKGDLEQVTLDLPPLPEQRKIADILTTWDETLTKLDALIEAQVRRKKALMQQLLTGKKRFPAYAKKPWRKVRMGDVLKRVFRPIDWSAEMSLSLVSLRRRCGGLFRRPDMLGADYKTQDLHELRADDFLISKRQVAHGAWGLVTPDFGGSHVSKEYAILVNTAPEKLHMPFFAWLCQTPRMIRLSRVASTGVHIEKLIFDPDVFLRDSIRIPNDLEEQRQIAAILDAADQQLALLRAQRTALDQQKRGLMQRLLTGKLRVRVQKEEVVS